MRQPEFKGFSQETGTWHYGFGWCLDGLTEECKEREGIKDYAVLYTDEYPVICKLKSMSQYTGMNDKNGNKIYEGDVVQAREQSDKAQFKGYVNFSNGQYWVNYIGYESYCVPLLQLVNAVYEPIEVIGHI